MSKSSSVLLIVALFLSLVVISTAFGQSPDRWIGNGAGPLAQMLVQGGQFAGQAPVQGGGFQSYGYKKPSVWRSAGNGLLKIGVPTAAAYFIADSLHKGKSHKPAARVGAYALAGSTAAYLLLPGYRNLGMSKGPEAEMYAQGNYATSQQTPQGQVVRQQQYAQGGYAEMLPQGRQLQVENCLPLSFYLYVDGRVYPIDVKGRTEVPGFPEKAMATYGGETITLYPGHGISEFNGVIYIHRPDQPVR